MKKENLLIRLLKFLGRLIHAIFLFLLSILGFFLYPSKEKKKRIKRESTLQKETKKIKIKDHWEEIDVPNTLSTKPLKEISTKELKIITEEMISKMIETVEEVTHEEKKEKIIELKDEVFPIIKEAITETKITKPQEVMTKIYETIEKNLSKEEKVIKKEKREETLKKEGFDLKNRIKKVYLKEIKQEELDLSHEEEKLLKEIEKHLLTIYEEKKPQEIDNLDLDEEIKQEIKKYTIQLIKEEKIKEYEISEKISKYIDKIIEENKRITLIPEKKEAIIKEPPEKSEKKAIDKQESLTADTPKNILKTEPLKEEKPKEKLEEKEKENQEEITLNPINFSFLDNQAKELELETQTEILKTELEDKEYEKIEQRIDILLDVLNQEKNKTLSESSKIKLALEEQKLMNLKKSLEQDKTKTIENEKIALNEKISIKELNGLEKEIQKLYLNDVVKQANYLEHYSYEKQEKIKRMLITTNLKKACKWSRFPLLFSLPFVRNKFFYFFTGSVLFSHHLNIYSRLLNNQKIENLEENLNEIEIGAQALEEAIDKTNQNLALLNELVNESLIKYPELKTSKEFRRYEKRIKENLMHNHQKLERKKTTIDKYHLKSEHLIRKLKKNVV